MRFVMSTPQQRVEQDVIWVSCQTTEGMITVQPGHAPFVALIAPHSTIILALDETRTESHTVAHGYLMVEPQHVIVITS